MTGAPWVEQIEERFLPELRRLAADLARVHPDVTVRAGHHRVGSSTELHGHDFVVECLFKDRGEDESDNITLTIGVTHLTTRPKLAKLDVCWGHPSGTLE